MMQVHRDGSGHVASEQAVEPQLVADHHLLRGTPSGGRCGRRREHAREVVSTQRRRAELDGLIEGDETR